MPLWVKAVALGALVLCIGVALGSPDMIGIGLVILVLVAAPVWLFTRGRRGFGGGSGGFGSVDQAMAERDRALTEARIGGERFVQQMRQRETIRGKQAVAQAKAATAALDGKWVN